MEEITQKEYNSIHSDFKGLWSDWVHRVLKIENWVTVSSPVVIMKDIFLYINKNIKDPKEKTIEKWIELLKILWFNAMSKEIYEWKHTIKETCEYLLNNCLGVKEKKILIELLKISKQCNI